ncbi:hypothetical protein TNCV_1948121 [Trichonephila clavipes]|nr:hypothetical protein TNCV_1948121 [Trichonephila clavipes]
MVYQENQAIAVKNQMHCWTNNGRNISVGKYRHMRIEANMRQQLVAYRRAILVQITMVDRRGLTTWSPSVCYHGHVGLECVLHKSPQTVYSRDVLSRQMVGRWCCMFSKGIKVRRLKVELITLRHKRIKKHCACWLIEKYLLDKSRET